MKNIIIIILCLIPLRQLHAQNNQIFTGGGGDGWNSRNYLQLGNNIYTGGNSDGWARNNYLQQANEIYNGGPGDGWSHDSATIILTIRENSFGSGLLAYPNPTNSKLNIDLGSNYQQIQVDVFTISGQNVSSKEYNNVNTIALDIMGATGIYFVNLKSKDKSAIIRLVKN